MSDKKKMNASNKQKKDGDDIYPIYQLKISAKVGNIIYHDLGLARGWSNR